MKCIRSLVSAWIRTGHVRTRTLSSVKETQSKQLLRCSSWFIVHCHVVYEKVSKVCLCNNITVLAYQDTWQWLCISFPQIQFVLITYLLLTFYTSKIKYIHSSVCTIDNIPEVQFYCAIAWNGSTFLSNAMENSKYIKSITVWRMLVILFVSITINDIM